MFSYFCFASEIWIFTYLLFLIIFFSFFTGFVWRRQQTHYLDLTRWALFLSLFVVIILLIWGFSSFEVSCSFSFGLRFDYTSQIAKLVVLFLFCIYLIFLLQKDGAHLEFILISLGFLLSSLLLLSANDLIILFLLIDLQAITLFFLISYDQTSMKSTEAA